MPKPSRRGNVRKEELKEAVKALSVAAKSLALASDALSRLYDTDEDDTSASETDSSSIPVESAPHNALHKSPETLINYEDSDDEYMELARNAISVAATAMNKVSETQSPNEENKPTWSEMQNNFGPFEMSGSGTESESGRITYGRSNPPASKPHMPDYKALKEPTLGSHVLVLSNSINPSNPSNLDADSVVGRPPAPKTWAHLARESHERWGAGAFRTFQTNESFDVNTMAGYSNDNSKSGTEELFANLKNRWASPTEIQHKVLRPLRAGSDLLLLHANLKSHVHAILIHCVQTIRKERRASNPVGTISVLVIVPQQTTGRLFLHFANELISDFNLPHRALLLPGGGSDVAIETERMSTERIDILISSPRIFVNHVNSNPNLPNHLSQIRFVVYAGAHELTKNDAFLNFQFNMIKKRMPTRAKSPRQIIISAAYMDDHIQVFANRGLHPGYITVHGAESDDNLRTESWENLLIH
ncbi:unnamed protein product [Rhizoctonia solani]|uniref:Uncharacterized protein n=1 Tax=Rhizoctonia solani TaxID=456999 RepID=A0A8H3B4C2_9AGAM|nr:unnamed protein product [Rhizoctonia solani]